MSARKPAVPPPLGVAVLALALFWAPCLVGQESGGTQAQRIFLLPFEIDADQGAANGDAVIARLLPVNTVRITEEWQLVNVALITVADAPGGRPGAPGNPEPVPSPRVFGLSDLTDALLYSPIKEAGLQWGLGLALGIPTASNDALGSGKWQVGPAARLNYQAAKWRLGLLVTTRWSFAGDEDREEVRQLLARGLIRRPLGKKWFFLSAPIITANWRAARSQRWLVPLGGGIGYSISTRFSPLNVSLQGYVNALKPDGAPDSVVRVAVTLPIRVARRQ